MQSCNFGRKWSYTPTFESEESECCRFLHPCFPASLNPERGVTPGSPFVYELCTNCEQIVNILLRVDYNGEGEWGGAWCSGKAEWLELPAHLHDLAALLQSQQRVAE